MLDKSINIAKMAHITEFKLYGLLGRTKPIHLKLKRDLNVFFGDNGSGKTTLLKVLDAAMSFDSGAMQRLPIDRAEVSVFSVNADKIITHIWDRKNEANLDDSDTYQLELDVYQDRFVRRASDRPITKWHVDENVEEVTRWRHIFLPTTRLYLDENNRAQLPNRTRTEREIDEQFAAGINQSWLKYYSQVITEIRSIQEQGLTSVLSYALAEKAENSVGPTLDPNVAYDRAARFLDRQTDSKSILGTRKSFVRRYKNEEKLRRLVDDLNNTEEKIERCMEPIDNFMATISGFLSNGKELSLGRDELYIRLNDGSLITPSSLSSGEKHLLKLLLSAMQAEESSIIIDEPELSLHIDWQKKLLLTMGILNPNCQMIVASHSPEIMADVPDDRIFHI
jgi:predicted ATPase